MHAQVHDKGWARASANDGMWARSGYDQTPEITQVGVDTRGQHKCTKLENGYSIYIYN
jgi:hypothetical protein